MESHQNFVVNFCTTLMEGLWYFNITVRHSMITYPHFGLIVKCWVFALNFLLLETYCHIFSSFCLSGESSHQVFNYHKNILLILSIASWYLLSKKCPNLTYSPENTMITYYHQYGCILNCNYLYSFSNLWWPGERYLLYTCPERKKPTTE